MKAGDLAAGRLVWALAALLVGLTVGLTALHVSDEAGAGLREAEASMARAAQNAAAAVNRNVIGIDLQLAAQVRSIEQMSRLQAQLDAQALSGHFLDQIKQQLLMRDLALVDAQGRVLAAAQESTRRQVSQAPLEFVGRVLADPVPTLRFSVPALNPATGEKSVWLGRSLTGPQGVLVLLGEVPVTVLSGLLGPAVGQGTWTVTLERSDGVLLAVLPHDEARSGARLGTPLRSQPYAGPVIAAPGRLDGLPSLLAVQASHNPELSVSAGIAEATVLADVQSGHVHHWWSAALISVLIVALAAALQRHLERLARVRVEVDAARLDLLRSHENLQRQMQAREQADAEREQAQAMMSSLLAHTQEGFWHIDAEGFTIDVNPAMCAMLGRRREDILGRGVFDFVDAANAAQLRCQLALRSQGQGSTYELSLLHADGRSVTCINNASPVFDAEGRRSGSIGLWTDISAMKAAEHELVQAKTTLERALDAMAEGFLLFDRNDRLITWNRHYEDLFPHLRPVLHPGMPLQEMHRASARHLLASSDESARERWIAQRARHHRDGSAPLEIVQPDGRVFEIVESETPDGGFVAVYRDISAAKAAQVELAEAKATLDQALDTMSDGFVVFDARERLLVWNRRYIEMLPYLRGRLEVGMSLSAVGDIAARALMPDAGEAEREAFKAKRRMERLTGQGVSARTLFGGVVVESVDRRTADGKLVTLFRDVTHIERESRALTEARDAAEAAARAKTQFLAAMSHEIRTPLNAVLGMNGLLMDTPLDAEQRRYVELIGKSGESLLAVINDILDLSRLEAGKLTLEVVDFSLAGAVRDVVSMMSARAQALGLALDLQGVDDPLLVRGDPSRLRQVLFNLVGNAIKFTERGRVTVDVEHRDAEGDRLALSIIVRDTGIGIAPEALPRLFERFSQADGSTSRRFGGSGLGLSICREIVQLMGGRIEVQSRPGEGSAFVVALELERAQGKVEESHFSNSAPGDLAARGLRVLVAEDNGVNQLLIRSLLAKLGHYQDIVANGVEAVRQVQAAPYDLVLMDVQMPQMDGITATRAIRALDGAAARVPIVAMTANVMTEDRAACVAAGMNGFVGKPIDRHRLHEAIERAVHQTEPALACDSTS